MAAAVRVRKKDDAAVRGLAWRGSMHARAWLVAVAAGGTIGVGLSAHAAYRAISEHPARARVTSIAASGAA
jgi:hypothetical protein